MLELTRIPGERRAYRLGDKGSFRFGGFFSHRARAIAGGLEFTIGSPRPWSRVIEALAADESLLGRFEPRHVRRGGTLHWRGVDYALRPTSATERYVLRDAIGDIATARGSSWPGWRRQRPDAVLDVIRADVDDALLLFLAYVVRALAARAASDSAAGGAASIAATGG
jgi:hypothetical protein